MNLISSRLLTHKNGRNAVFAAAFCAFTTICLIYSISVTKSHVITATTWISVFSFFTLFSTIISFSNSNVTNKNYTFGFARAQVLAIFTTTVLAQLFSIFLIKEAVEGLIVVNHHNHHYHYNNINETNIINHLYFSSFANIFSLMVAAYAVKNQPFNSVLSAANSSIIQEHAADISRAICHIIPGLSRLLLPRINSLSLLAIISTICCILTQFFINDFWWFDAIATLFLSGSVFLTMMPLSAYTGRILLQTTPPHIHNQIDRCISEASTIDGVLELKNGHFWQLDFNRIIGTIDVRIRRDANEQLILGLVTEKFLAIVNDLTIQILKDVTTTWNSSGDGGGGGGGSGSSLISSNYYYNQNKLLMSPHLTTNINNKKFIQNNNYNNNHGHSH